MKKLLAIALFAMVGVSSTATAYWGWYGRGAYGYYGYNRSCCNRCYSGCNSCGYYY